LLLSFWNPGASGWQLLAAAVLKIAGNSRSPRQLCLKTRQWCDLLYNGRAPP